MVYVWSEPGWRKPAADRARHASRPDLHSPALDWDPVIAPGGMAFYRGDAFPRWRGSLVNAGLVSEAPIRVVIGSDGTVWYVEDDDPGRLSLIR
ncbi:PQQ-dependent sugar dehydrogenase [Nonomuraea lactucae]|uniref:PQQ-dependent sugar dehydrogenase n=1 Tax=Nonomuraea lactucae TaxID=2249762 RepID=UPI0019665ACF